MEKMRCLMRMAAVFVASLAIAKLVAALLNTRAARRLAQNAGAEALLTSEGKDVLQRYSRSATSLILATLADRKSRRWGSRSLGHSAYAGWPAALDSAAEMLSTGGALARMASDFWRERLELENRSGSRSLQTER